MTGADTAPAVSPASADPARVRALVTRLWALAVLVHLLGNPAVWFGDALPSPQALPVLAMALLGGAVVVRPSDRWLVAGLVAAVAATAVLRLPVLANNLVLAVVVGLALLAVRDDAAVAAVRRAGTAAYVFAAFAKLNTDFLDPTVSCAPVLLERLLGGLGLPLPPEALVAASPWLAVVVEGGVAVGLLVPATRRHAALLGVLFHGVLAYDLLQHFWDFTTALLPLFAAAAPAVALGVAGRASRRVPPLVGHVALALLVLGGVLSTLPVPASIGLLIGHLVWIVGGTAFVLAWVLAHLEVSARGRRGPRVATASAAPWTAGVAVLVVAVVLNGLAPYVQLKSGWSWNMYANLRVVDDTTNHLVVPAVDLRGDHDELLVLTATSDEALDRYVEDRAVVPAVQLTDWVSRTPGAVVEVVAVDADGSVGGAGRTLTHEEVQPGRPWWFVRVLPLRPVDPDCLLSYGPLG